MEPIIIITSFAVSIAAGIVNNQLSKATNVDKEIKQAFEKAKKDWSKHELSFIKESELKIYLNQLYENPKIFDEISNKERYDFYIKFQKRLSETTFAKDFLSDIRDDNRFKKIISSIQDIKEDTQYLKDKFKNFSKEIKESGFIITIERITEICNPFILELKPASALKIVNKLEEYINQKPQEISETIKANVWFYKATCYEAIGKSNESYEYFIKAYNAVPSDIKYLEKACILYYLHKNEKYIKLLKKLEKEDEFNPRLWAIKTLEAEEIISFIENHVPENVIDKTIYKRNVFNKSLNEKYEIISSITKVLNIPKIIGPLPEKITYYDLYDWILILNFLINDLLFSKPTIKFFDFIEKDEKIIYLFELSKLLSETIAKSELKNMDHSIHFMYYWMESELEVKPNTLGNLRKSYDNLKIKDALHTTLFANAFQKQGEKKMAKKIINDFKGEMDEQLMTLKTFLTLYTSDNTEIRKNISDFLEFEKSVTENNIQNYCKFIIQIIRKNVTEKQDLQKYTNKLEVSNPNYSELIKLTIKSHYPSESNLQIEEIDKLRDRLSNEPELNHLIASLYYENEYFNESIKFIESYIDENILSPSLLLLIESLKASSNSDKVKLMRLLKDWREKEYPFDIQLLGYEIQYKQMIQIWKDVIDIADYVLSKFPNEEYFYICLLNALENDKKSKRIKEEVQKIKEFQFQKTEWALRAAGILLRQGYLKEVLDIVYNEAKDENNSDARLSYFGFSTTEFQEFFNLYETVEEGRYVTYEINGKEKTIYLEGESLELPIIKKSYGKSVNETFLLEGKFNSTLEQVRIKRITNKYLALLDEIRENAETSISNPLIQTIKFEKNDLESINKAFIENFGAKEEEYRKKAKENLSAYNIYRMPFFQLVSANFKGSFVDAYLTLTLNNGYLVKPLQHVFKNFSFKGKKIVIDFTSGLLLFNISKKFDLKYNSKFIVSKNIYHFIDKTIYETDKNKNSKMTLSVYNNRVVPHIFSDEFHDTRINYLKEIKNWFEKNTESDIPKEKLNIVAPLYEKGQVTLAIDLFTDNMFLALRDGYILLTDDLVYNDKLSPDKNITTEKYLIENFPEKKNRILEYMLELKYVGITLNSEVLYSAYINQNKEGKGHIYNYCLRNLSLRENYCKENINMAVSYLKKLALNPIIRKDIYKQTATNMFLMLINSFPDLKLVFQVKTIISKEFELLFDYQYLTLEAFLTALDIKNRSI
ncbi:MAG: hypothetical protein IMY72_09155 [Bacteroidetes bacterium]|nr:hypothetical protein [Bacteroidota bacterium]